MKNYLIGFISCAALAAILYIVFAPHDLLVKQQVYWVAFTLVTTALIILGLHDNPEAMAPYELDSEGLTEEQAEAKRGRIEKAVERALENEKAWAKSLSFVSSLILTACGFYFFMEHKETPCIDTAMAILALTATFNMTSALLLPICSMFYVSCRFQQSRPSIRFLANINSRLAHHWHTYPVISCCIQFAAVAYIITMVAF